MAYFKKSQSRKADFVKEDSGRFIKVGEGYGDYILVRTARDKQIRNQRDSYYSSLPIPLVVAIHDLPRRSFQKQSLWTKKDVYWFWKWFDHDLDAMEAYREERADAVAYGQARCMVTALREHRWLNNETAWARDKHLRRPITIEGQTYYADASPGYVAYDRHNQAWRSMELHNIDMAIRAFRNQSVLWYLKKGR